MSPHPRPQWLAAAGLILAAALLGAPAVAADPVDPFIGTYVGRAQVMDAEGRVVEERDMDITIAPSHRHGFTITWVNVTLIDGRRDVPGVRRRVDRVVLVPGGRDGIYMEEARRSLFERRRDIDVIAGDPMRWGRIDGNRLGVFSLVVLDDGGYALQSYERILTDVGLDIEFSRVENGQVTRRIVGHTIRVD